MTEKTLQKSIAINQELAKLKCTNPDCGKKETRVNKMCMFIISGYEEIFDDIKFTDKICCDEFKKTIEEKYNHLRQYLTVSR